MPNTIWSARARLDRIEARRDGDRQVGCDTCRRLSICWDAVPTGAPDRCPECRKAMCYVVVRWRE